MASYVKQTMILPHSSQILYFAYICLQSIIIIMKSSLQLSSNTPLHKQQLTKLKTIWQSLQDHNDSIQFRNPVNYKAMGLYDYPQYVKYPMDLSTIHRKLRQQRYRYVQEVLDDFQLIWDNCKCYNPPNSWIYNLSERLDKAFKKMVKSYLPSIMLPGSTNKNGKECKNNSNQAQKDEEASDPQDDQIPFHIKLQFVEKLRLLSPPSLKIITQLIAQKCPKAFVEDQQGKAQILVDLLNIEAYRNVSEKLEQLVVTDRSSNKKIKLY